MKFLRTETKKKRLVLCITAYMILTSMQYMSTLSTDKSEWSECSEPKHKEHT